MNFIVVVDKQYGIGRDNKLLTHLTDDLKYFKRTTLGKVVVMGRKTLESLPGGRPFQDRINIVLTRNQAYEHEGVTVVHDYDSLFQKLSHYDTEDVFVVGGGQIYEALYPYCKYGYITKINATFEADTYLENFDRLVNWELVWEGDLMTNNGFDFVWTKYENKSVKSYN